MPRLNLSLKEIEDFESAIYLVVEGSINKVNVGKFFTTLDSARSKGFKKIFLDLGKTKYLGSAALAYLINLAETLRNSGGDIVLIDVHPKVKVTLELLGLEGYFSFQNSFKEITSKETSPEDTAKLQSITTPEVKENLIECRSCGAKFGVTIAGRYRCWKCHMIFIYTDRREVIPAGELIQMNITLSEASILGFKSFLETFCQNLGLVYDFSWFIDDIFKIIKEVVYKNQNDQSVKISILASKSGFELRFIDKGLPLDSNSLKKLYKCANKTFKRFEIKQNKDKGNTIVLLKGDLYE